LTEDGNFVDPEMIGAWLRSGQTYGFTEAAAAILLLRPTVGPSGVFEWHGERKND